MIFDPENIPIALNDWFSTRIEYEGQGRAEFLDPHGAIEGRTRVQINENGTSNIEMAIDGMDEELPLPSGLMQLISGQKPLETGGGITLTGGTSNPCTRLSVSTPQGEFSATEGIHYGLSLGATATLTFTSLTSQFNAAGKGRPMYWVIPLSNFLSRFLTRHPSLDRHPLRIYPTPIIPDGLTEEDAFIATHNANLKNHLITFEFMGTPGFIEPLPDYDLREKSLTEGCERQSITAMMVGEVASHSIEQAGLKEWFPDDFLRLLSLVTGSPVGAPWIEFRNDQGELVRRVHVKLNQSPFSMGHRPLERGAYLGTGYLLTKYQSSPDRGKPFLNVVLKHLFHAGRHEQSIEDRFIYLARALENLCQHYGFKSQYLMRSLDTHWQQIVKGILNTAAAQIRAEAAQAASKGRLDQSRTLNRIAERTIGTPGGKENSFGLAVAELLQLFSLPDAGIVDDHYLANPRPDGMTSWSSVLSKYRGAPVHSGFFNISEKEHDFDDILTIETHLHDLLLRIVFKIIGYDGFYQPPVRKLTSDTPVDWVVAGLSARELGYR